MNQQVILVAGLSLLSGAVCPVRSDTGSAGVQTWITPYHEPLDNHAAAQEDTGAVALDAQGNVFVTGSVSTNGSQWVMLTAKYAAATGALLWERHYEFPGSPNGNSVAVDGKGNVVVAGITLDASYLLVVEYDSDGDLIWEQHYSGASDEPAGSALLTLDKDGNVFIAGQFWNSAAPSSFIGKLASGDGTLLWRNDGKTALSALGRDNDGNLIVAGASLSCSLPGCSDADLKDEFLIKYAARDGRQLWASHRLAPNGIRDNTSPGLAVAQNGDVAISESFRFTTKYTADGHVLWERLSEGWDGDHPGSSRSRIGIDLAGNVFLLAGGNLIKYASANGALLWKQPLQYPAGLPVLAVDDIGNVLVASADDARTFHTQKYAGTDGTLLWDNALSKVFAPEGELGGLFAGLATGPNGTAAAVVDFWDSDSLQSFATIAYHDRLPSLSIELSKEGTRVRFDGSPDVTSELTRADHIRGPWRLVGTFNATPDGVAEYLDVTATSGQAFYRVNTSFLSGQTKARNHDTRD